MQTEGMVSNMNENSRFIDVARVPIERPNGKTYRPRKITVERWENEGYPNDQVGVVVLGTHDVEAVQPLADAWIKWWFDHDYVAGRPDADWYRLGYRGYRGEMAWIQDEVRGRAGVMFTACWPDGEPA